MIQPLLEGGPFLLNLLDHSGDSAEFGFHARGGYDPFPPSIGNHGGGKDHIGPISHGQFRLMDGIRRFLNGDGLPC